MEREVQAERPAGRLPSLVGGDRGERRPDDVTCGEHPRAAGAPFGVDKDPAAAVDVDACFLQAEARSADGAAGGEQQRFGPELPPVIQFDNEAVAVPARRGHAGAEDDLIPAGADDLLEPPGYLAVHHGGEPRRGVHDGDEAAERGEDGGVLDPDRAATDDQQLAWPVPHVRDGLGVSHARIAEGHPRWPQWPRPGRDDDPPGPKPPFRAVARPDHHGVVGLKPPFAADQLYATLTEPVQRDLPELLANLASPVPDGRVRHLRRRGQGDAVDFLFLERAEVGCGLPERLGRRAAAGHHRAADHIPLGQRDRITQHPGEFRRRRARRAGTDHHQIEIAHVTVRPHTESPSTPGVPNEILRSAQPVSLTQGG